MTLFEQFGFEQFASPLVRNCALVLLLPFAYMFILIREGAVVAAFFLILRKSRHMINMAIRALIRIIRRKIFIVGRISPAYSAVKLI